MSQQRVDNRLLTAVLSQYPAPLRAGNVVSLGNRGGFSGARLWRLEYPDGAACVRLWPEDATLAARLPWIHERMRQARAAGLEFVPALILSTQGQTWLEHDGLCWEITQWLAGQANFHANPSADRLREACRSLAQLHLCWAQTRALPVVCPAVIRRLESYCQWAERVHSGWSPAAGSAALVRRAWQAVLRFLDRVPTWLLPWSNVTWPLQPCLCDVWHDHLLFEGDRMAGLVDYGAVKMDHPSVDLARMLGSLVEDDSAGWQEGLRAYREVTSFPIEDEALARALDRSGALLAVANWLRWLAIDKRSFDDPKEAERRLAGLVTRVERWQE